MTVFNLLDGALPDDFDRPGFAHRRARVFRDQGAELLGGTLYETPPGEKLWPYHWELGCEEWLVVVSGSPTLRSPAGERELSVGEIVHFPQGMPGAHQLLNRSDAPFRVLICSTKADLAVAGYPDSEKLYVTAPVFDVDRVVPDRTLDYWDDES
ncbi:MAG TPA: cupin domain-containing protein [Gaiellaceae bacterium]|nr:cupin domain-containing protein [Gaiellaceae bacterium]